MPRGSDSPAENSVLGRKMIETAIKLEESVAELLLIHVRHMKELRGDDLNQEIAKANKLLRNIIFTLTLTDERITKGMDLCGLKPQINRNRPSWISTKEDIPD